MRSGRKSRIRCTAVAAFALAAVAMTPSPASASTLEVDRNAVIDRINIARIAQGTCPFGFEETVQATSQSWVGQVASAGRLAHNANRPRGAGASAENVGMGATAVEVYEKFLQSPKHHENMMDPRFDRIGIGIEYSGGRTWATLNFTASNPRGC